MWIYKQAGFHVQMAHMDGEFSHLQTDSAELGIAINETVRDEHVADIERFIHIMKDHMRSIYDNRKYMMLCTLTVPCVSKSKYSCC